MDQRRRRRRAILKTWSIVNNAVTKAESGSQKLDQRTHTLVSPADWYRPTDRSTDWLTDWLTTHQNPKMSFLLFLHQRETDRHTQTHTEKRKRKIMIRCWRWDQCVEWKREIQHQKDPRERCLSACACTKRENSETMKKTKKSGEIGDALSRLPRHLIFWQPWPTQNLFWNFHRAGHWYEFNEFHGPWALDLIVKRAQGK